MVSVSYQQEGQQQSSAGSSEDKPGLLCVQLGRCRFRTEHFVDKVSAVTGISGSCCFDMMLKMFASSCVLKSACRYFLVTVPAVLQAGTKTQFCAILYEPGEFVVMTVHLKSEDSSQTLLKKGTSNSFMKCFSFHVPLVEKCEIQLFEVKVEGPTVYSKEVKKVLIKTVKPQTFIQTDAAIYNPGQTVRFRAVTLNRDLKPVDEKDPHNAIIGQWVNQQTRRNILEQCFQLSSGASEGYYRIVLKAGKERFYQTLPKFDIKVTIPKEISIGQEHFEVEVCAKSRCGKPVTGSAVVTVCRPVQNRIHCSSVVTYEDHKSGCATLKFEVSAFTGTDPEAFFDVLDVSATVRDKFTSIAHTKWERINITYSIGRLSFLEIPQTYIQGQPLNGKVVVFFCHVVCSAVNCLYLFKAESLFPDHVDALETDKNGVAQFSLDTDRFRGSVLLKVRFQIFWANYYATKPGEHEKHKTPFFTSATTTVSESGPGPTTGGFLRVQTVDKPLRCGETEEITIQYSLKKEYTPILEVIYLVSFFPAVVAVVCSLQRNASAMRSVAESRISIDLSWVFANNAFVYVFVNQVVITYDPSFAVPGESIKLNLKADPNSLCGVRAIDFRTIIKEPGTLLDAHQIFDLLPIKKTDSIPYELLDASNCLHVRPKRSLSGFTNQDGEYAFTIFEVRMLILSNLAAQNPKCLRLKGKKYFRDLDIFMKLDKKSAEVPAIPEPGTIPYSCPYVEPLEPVHTLESEPWIFELYNVGSHGKRCVHLTVPDVVTSWDTDAFCLNSHSFGVAQRKTLFVAPPFVLHLAMPDSIFLGESFVLKATITNNVQSCIKVKSGISMRFKTLNGTASVTITASAVDDGTLCEDHPVVVPENGHTIVKKRSIDVKVGDVDRHNQKNEFCMKLIFFSVKVKLLCFLISLLSKNVTKSDVLSRLVQNLGQPLDFPYENGDWNIASMAINIYVLNYLKETHQLEQSMKEEEAVSFLKKGTFLLTALVMVTLYQAQPFIFIDENVMNEARKWLECQQRENGCFRVLGKHSTKRKGVIRRQIQCFLERPLLLEAVSFIDPVVKKGLCCLKESIKDLQNPFAAAISAWVFTLAGDLDHRAELLHYLDKIAIKDRDFIYWTHEETETSVYSSLLISSYVILAKLTVTGSPGDLKSASYTFKWLVEQLNYFSTFSSTQDTMMAVKAIALYSKCMFTPVWSSTVSIWSPNDQIVFHLTPHNKLLYQEMVLQDTKGKYNVKMEGTACALVQVLALLESSFCCSLDFTIMSCSTPVTCHSRYSGHQSCTNMVVLEIQLPSGFCPLPQSLRSVSPYSRFSLTGGVRRFEMNGCLHSSGAVWMWSTWTTRTNVFLCMCARWVKFSRWS
uniref:Alpha-2-macroglobulin domain-containing protein n=1 Tax=Oryzias melastigma TaxID=30732 RepID=A0A3B3CPZ6_ORYME